MVSRRQFVAMMGLSLPALVHASERFGEIPSRTAALERTAGGRFGVAVLDTSTGERSGYRADERFPMCSTFKFLLASAVLRRVDRGEETLDQSVAIPTRPLLSNSPLTEPHEGRSMTIGALCQAIITRSDNTAANLLLDTIGGPPGLTSFARSIGDTVTRLDRTELSLNESLAGDPRDTTSPAAMAGDLRAVLLGEVLSFGSRSRLIQWMASSLPGLKCLRAGFPPGWRIADKTGSNGTHTHNDIAVVWPPRRRPILVAAYITQCPGPESKREGLLAAVGRLVAHPYS
jgi:beta-lactamase class A